MKQTFTQEGIEELVARLEKLNSDTPPLWGSMTVSQMLKHCSLLYIYLIKGGSQRPKWYVRLVASIVYKPAMVNEKPYKQGLPTAPNFIIKGDPKFEETRKRLIGYIQEVHGYDKEKMENKVHPLIGKLSMQQWNNVIYKHIDHHLRQFGV